MVSGSSMLVEAYGGIPKSGIFRWKVTMDGDRFYLCSSDVGKGGLVACLCKISRPTGWQGTSVWYEENRFGNAGWERSF